MKRSWKRPALLLGLVLAIGLAGFFLIQPGDPYVQGKRLSRWVLEFQNRSSRRDAEAAIRAVGPRAIPLLFSRIRSENWLHVRIARRIWDTLPESLQSHLPAPRSVDPFFPAAAGHALASFGPPAVPELANALKDPNWRVRQAALEGIWGIGAGADSAVPAVVKMLDDEVPMLRARAVQTLIRMGPARKQAVPALVDLLDAAPSSSAAPGEVPLSTFALLALGAMGPDAVAALPELRKMWMEPDTPAGIRFQLGMALWRIDSDPRVVSWLVVQLETAADFDTCSILIQSLGEIGPKAKEAVPLILEKKQDRRLARGFFGRDLAPVCDDALKRIDPAVAQAQPPEQFQVLDLKSLQLTNAPAGPPPSPRRAPRQPRRALRSSTSP